MNAFTWRGLALRSLWGHRRSHAAVACGVAVAATVLVGALVVGDSVRVSLRDLTLQRLGSIDYAVAPGRPFRIALADEISADAAPLVIAPASLSRRVDGKTRRASGATLIGCDRRFWRLGAAPDLDDSNGVIVTEELAGEIGLSVGDDFLLRTTRAQPLPADSPLGEKADTVASMRLTAAAIVPAEGLARFSLAPSQAEPRNIFVPIETAQRLVGVEGEATAVVLSAEQAPEVEPTLADYGMTFDQPRSGVWQLESRELVLPDDVVEPARIVWSDRAIASAITYLANVIRVGDRKIPYSTVAGVGGEPSLAPATGLGADEIALTRWAADDLGAKVGDEVTLTYYEPESTHGVLREAPAVTLRLAQILEPLAEAGGPTNANDRRWTPRLEGVTDAESINDWDLPFELVENIRDADEDYWDEYGTTPKAFVSYELANRLWASRWGTNSLLRVAGDEQDGAALAAQLRAGVSPSTLGFEPIALRERGLAASAGNTPFDVLFLLFSMFLIGAALGLIVLLVWLAVEERRRELGLLGAIGYRRQKLRHLLMHEMAPVAATGAAVGAALGVAYAAGLLTLLKTVWLDAIGTPFLELHASPLTFLGGAFAAWLVAMVTIYLAIHVATKQPPKNLLSLAQETPASARTARWPIGVALGGAALSGVSAMSGAGQQGEAAAGAFFGAGGLALVALVAGLYAISSRDGGRRDDLALPRLAGLNLRRRPGRALLTVGLLGAATFLLLATSAFRLPPTASGTGGFDLIATADQPIHYDLATEDGRFELGFNSKDEATLAAASVFGFRVQAGEDASCRNLYQPSQPRVLGVTPRFIENADLSDTPFEWADSGADGDATPWRVLADVTQEGAPVPVVLDFNTAVYSLKLYGGVGSTFTIEDETGESITLRVAGLLKNSVLQGDVLMGEAEFLRLFPSAGGYAFFLADAKGKADEVAALLEDTLGDYGLDAELAANRLARFLAVQNTYLSTFQALGGLGLVLGAIGLAVAQFRNLLERRGELALMRAGGFSRGRLRRLVLLENLVLLAAGLIVGAVAAAATLLPLSAASDARPPWLMALVLVAATIAVGLIAARIAASKALSAPLVTALRGE